MAAADAMHTRLVAGADRTAALHAAELPQKDELCGAFWGLLALRLAGHQESDGAALDQEAVALAAGTVLAPGDHVGVLPPGEPGRRDYRLALPVTDRADASGTSAAGVARAVAQLSDGALRAVPIAGPWDDTTVVAAVGIAADVPGTATLIANVSTGPLWGGRPSVPALLGYLATGIADGPEADWDVGHFVGVLGTMGGPGGPLAIVADTYGSLGYDGVHLQPVERLAAALRRDREAVDGGLLLVVPSAYAPVADRQLRNAGLVTALWDNGSPDHQAALPSACSIERSGE
jgi:hypothetical protein